MMPRPGVGFPIDIALIESDRQAIANGITTVFHGVTWSWEPGLRGPENARAVLAGIERLRGRLGADTRYHLRHETYNLDAEHEIIGWMESGRIDALAFNDHMTPTPHGRSGRTRSARWPSAPASRARRSTRWSRGSSGAATKCRPRSSGSPRSRAPAACRCCRMTTPARRMRAGYRALGCRVAEFPTNEETAAAPRSRQATCSCSAPRTWCAAAATPVGPTRPRWSRRGWCAILASDYYYPAPLLAAFRLAELGAAPLAEAWRADLASAGGGCRPHRSRHDRGRAARRSRAGGCRRRPSRGGRDHRRRAPRSPDGRVAAAAEAIYPSAVGATARESAARRPGASARSLRSRDGRAPAARMRARGRP